MPKQEIDIKSCYGKSMIFRGVDKCPHKRSECPWGEACLSASNEEWENVRYHKYRNVSLGQIFFDSSENSGDECKNDKEKNALLEVSAKSCEPEFIEDEADIVLENLRIPDSSYEVVLKAIEAIAGMYFDAPSAFECMMKKIYHNKKQADVAKENNITRQGLNKRLLHELGIAQKRNDIQERRDRELKKAKLEYSGKLAELREKDEFLKTLSERDWMIYKLYFVDSANASSVARQLNTSKRTVYRVARFLRSNMGENGNIKVGRPKKNAKKSKNNL